MGERGSALKEGSGRGKKEGGWGNKKRISSSLGFFVVVLFCFFCIHLRVAIGEPLHTRMVKIWHTQTHKYGGGEDTVSALSESLRPCCRQRSGFYFRHEC